MTKSKAKTETNDPRDGNEDKFEDTPQVDSTQAAEDALLDPVTEEPQTEFAQTQPVYKLPDTPNPSDPTSVTGTAVPLSITSGPASAADIGATGDLTGTPQSRREKGDDEFRS